MKTTILVLMSCVVSAWGGTSYKEMYGQVQKLEDQKEWVQASLLSASYANKIATRAKFDDLLYSETSEFTEEREERVIGKRTTNVLFNFLMSGAFSESYDVTKIIVTNPKAVALAPVEEAERLGKLQKKITAYVASHESELFHAKIFAAKAFQLAGHMEISELVGIYPRLAETAQRVSNINFLGAMNVLNCVKEKHAKKKWIVNETVAYLDSFLKKSQKDVQKAYTTKECSLRTVDAEVSEFGLKSARLLQADQTLEVYAKMLGLKLFVEMPAPYYPDWGSPYYQ